GPEFVVRRLGPHDFAVLLSCNTRALVTKKPVKHDIVEVLGLVFFAGVLALAKERHGGRNRHARLDPVPEDDLVIAGKEKSRSPGHRCRRNLRVLRMNEFADVQGPFAVLFARAVIFGALLRRELLHGSHDALVTGSPALRSCALVARTTC